MSLSNVKLRRFLDRIKWPLVTRARYQQNKDNYEAELKATGAGADSYLSQLRASRDNERNLKQEVAELQRLLKDAQKNDHRDPETGRFEKAE